MSLLNIKTHAMSLSNGICKAFVDLQVTENYVVI